MSLNIFNASFGVGGLTSGLMNKDQMHTLPVHSNMIIILAYWSGYIKMTTPSDLMYSNTEETVTLV